MLATLLAVACMAATGLLDLVFKFYSNGENSRGLMMAGAGATWAALQTLYLLSTDHAVILDYTTLFYGGMAAVVLVGSNILLLESLGRLPVSVASTIYRLNTVPLVLLAVVFLGENPGWLTLSGVGLGLVSVYLLYSRSDAADASSTVFTTWFLVIISACCLRALYGIFLKAGLSEGAVAESMILLAAIAWLVGGLLQYFFVDSHQRVEKGAIRLIVLAGVLVFTIVWLLTKALSLADAVNVMPIANMGFVAAFVFAVAWRLEGMNIRKFGAILVAIASIAVISYAS